MKAVLQYDASKSVRALVAAFDRPPLAIVQVDEDDAAAFAREIADADVLLHVLAPVTDAVMASAPRLKLVQKIGIGVDAIDLAAAKKRGIAVCNMPGTNTQAVAELALALMLACLRRVTAIDAEMHAGRGYPLRADLLDGLGEISGRTVGLLGYGAVPRRLAPVLRALGARVIACDVAATATDVEMMSLDDVLAQADIVSLHLPLTAETKEMMNARRLGQLRRGAIVINTARGALVDESALADALRTGHIAAAGLDVFAAEPTPPDNPLLAFPNVVATPHLAWLTDGTWRRSIDVIAENCRRLAAGEPLLHRVV
jgi:phosphoglycerate dehydrogenase-like enzyme